MLNLITIQGRLTRDPELRHTDSGVSVASFSIACDRDMKSKDTGERETDFVDVSAWRGTAEFVSKYFQKGSMILVTGRLQIRNWTDKEGAKRRSAEVVAGSLYFCESRKSQESNPYSQAEKTAPAATSGATAYAETLKEIERIQKYGMYGGAEQQGFETIDVPDEEFPF